MIIRYFLPLLLLGPLACGGEPPAQDTQLQTTQTEAPLEVTYIANEGFLVAVGDLKVMIDALHQNPWGYENTPEDVFTAMCEGHPPFDGVDLLIASHHHADHFSAHLVHPFLAQQSDVVFISSQQAVDTLASFAGDEYAAISGRVRNVNPEWGASEEVMVGEITVRLLTLNHVPADQEEGPFLTLGSLVDMGGRKILHLADLVPEATAEYLVGYGLEEEGIDVLFVDNFFVTSDIGPGLIRDHIHPKHIVIMHLRPEEREEVREQVQAVFPEAVVFDSQMERRVF